MWGVFVFFCALVLWRSFEAGMRRLLGKSWRKRELPGGEMASG
jgi:hypothetical protein